jgi:hypothetical protein
MIIKISSLENLKKSDSGINKSTQKKIGGIFK